MTEIYNVNLFIRKTRCNRYSLYDLNFSLPSFVNGENHTRYVIDIKGNGQKTFEYRHGKYHFSFSLNGVSWFVRLSSVRPFLKLSLV